MGERKRGNAIPANKVFLPHALSRAFSSSRRRSCDDARTGAARSCGFCLFCMTRE